MRVSHEATYRALNVQGRGAGRRGVTACLRTERALRVPNARPRGPASQRAPFLGHRWPLGVNVTAVRWSCRFRPPLADVRDLLAERSIDVSSRTVLSWVQTFGPLLAAAVRHTARPVGRHWSCDETSVRVAGRRAYRYRAVDEHGQVVDVLLRERRDLASARAFVDQAIARRGVRPKVVISDKHPAYRRAVRRRSWRATHVRTGLHRARGETTKAIERSHVPIKDRVRPMRGLHSVASGQRLLEGIELTQAIRRGHIGAAGDAPVEPPCGVVPGAPRRSGLLGPVPVVVTRGFGEQRVGGREGGSAPAGEVELRSSSSGSRCAWRATGGLRCGCTCPRPTLHALRRRPGDHRASRAAPSPSA